MGLGVLALAVAVLARPSAAGAAAGQDWPPFVLVTGLLLIGLVADEDGAFAAAGRWFAARRAGAVRVAWSMAAVVVVTAVLNLDTAAAFLTPVFAYAALRTRGSPSLLYACVLLANAGSLFLPGSNLTNLLVLGGHPISGVRFASAMWAPALGAAAVTALVVAVVERRGLVDHGTGSSPSVGPADAGRRVGWVGTVAALAAAAVVLVVTQPAVPVAVIGVLAVGVRVGAGRLPWARIRQVVGLPTLVGLFGVAVALGTLGRVWDGPSSLLARTDIWGTGALGAAGAVVLNNLPAASLLAARPPAHPFALLVGLNVGPNALATGSLAWLLWWRSARLAGSRPSLRRACALGAVSMPLALVAALGLLAVRG